MFNLKKVVGVALALGFSIFSFADATTSKLRCGGDGPRPLIDISAAVPLATSWVHQAAAVEDFVALEASGRWIFRTTDEDVYLTATNSSPIVNLGKSELPLSKILNSSESVLSVEGAGWMRPIFAPGQWQKYADRRLTPVFWKNRFQYSYETTASATGAIRYDFYRFEQGKRLKAVCSLDTSKIENGRLATGHADPFVFFYSTNRSSKGFKLSLWKLDPERCALTKLAFTSYFKHRPIAVHRFEKMDSTAVVFKQGQENVFWQTPEGCKSYTLENTEVFPLRPDVPVVALWTDTKELSLLFLREEKTVRLMRQLTIDQMRPNDIWINRTATAVAIAPYFGAGMQQRWLFEEKLQKTVMIGSRP